MLLVIFSPNKALSASQCLCVFLVMYLSSERLREKGSNVLPALVSSSKGAVFCEIRRCAVSFEYGNIYSVKFSGCTFEQIKQNNRLFFCVFLLLSFPARNWKEQNDKEEHSEIFFFLNWNLKKKKKKLLTEY